MTRTPRHPAGLRAPWRRLGTTTPRPRRLAAVAVAAVATLGLGSASAANLGVLSTSLATGSAAVTSCQNQAPITVSLVSQPTGSGFTTTAVDLSGINQNCVGQQYRLSVVRGAEPPTEVTGDVTSTTLRTAPFPAVATSSILRVEIVIHS